MSASSSPVTPAAAKCTESQPLSSSSSDISPPARWSKLLEITGDDIFDATNIGEKIANHQVPLTIPEGAEPLSHQVAGHRFGISKHRLGLLRHTESGDILKPIFDRRSEREYRFYALCFSAAADADRCLRELRQIVPRFGGLFHDTRMRVSYLRLRDETRRLRNSSQLDVKMGRITYDQEASAEKIRAERRKYRFARQLGFRILGMRIYDRQTKQYIVTDKDWGAQIIPDDVTKTLLTFAQHNRTVIEQLRQQLAAIDRWFRETNIFQWKFTSSSLLFVYGDDIDSGEPRTTIKMIDFAHVFTNDTPRSPNSAIFEHDGHISQNSNKSNINAETHHSVNGNASLGGDSARRDNANNIQSKISKSNLDLCREIAEEEEEDGEEDGEEMLAKEEEKEFRYYADGIDHNYLYGIEKLAHYLSAAATVLSARGDPERSQSKPNL